MAIPSWIDAKQLVIPSALIAADCPREADLALHIPGVRRFCALAMVRCVTCAWLGSGRALVCGAGAVVGHSEAPWPLDRAA